MPGIYQLYVMAINMYLSYTKPSRADSGYDKMWRVDLSPFKAITGSCVYCQSGVYKWHIITQTAIHTSFMDVYTKYILPQKSYRILPSQLKIKIQYIAAYCWSAQVSPTTCFRRIVYLLSINRCISLSFIM